MDQTSKRIGGVPATVVLTEQMADLIDDEITKRRLPSRSAMIRTCIEEYFYPTNRDDQEKRSQVEILRQELHFMHERIQFLQTEIDRWHDAYDGMAQVNTMIVGHGNRLLEATIKYKTKWYQFWRLEAPAPSKEVQQAIEEKGLLKLGPPIK